MVTLVLLAGCTDAPPGSDGVVKHVDGRDVRVVEWDLIAPESKMAPGDGVSTVRAPLIVNTVWGADDVWSSTQAQALSYCLSDEFGSNLARAEHEMRSATLHWELQVNVDFVYRPDQNGSGCRKEWFNNNGNVTFAVRPFASGGALAFFPGDWERTLWIDYADFDTNPNWDVLAPNLTTVGVYRHELGHVLGFRHEHTRPEASCYEDDNWRVLTPYDMRSVMHYQWCGGVTEIDLTIGRLDYEGARSIYGFSRRLAAQLSAGTL